MSVKVPEQTVEYQSHHHCQCDFCNSRRSVNAKKYGVSQAALSNRDAQKKKFPNYDNQFDPEYPAPVNQTALNAARGRNGIPEGDQYTIENRDTIPGNGASKARGLNASASGKGAREAPKKTKDEEAADALNELDRLERLLILEHKARVQASIDANQMSSIRTGTENRPQPLPKGYYGGGSAGAPGGANTRSLNVDPAGYGSTGGSNGPLYDGTFNASAANGASIRDAWKMAYECPVTPPPCCHASYQLQQAMNDIQAVTADPVNRSNRAALDDIAAGRTKPSGNTAGAPVSGSGKRATPNAAEQANPAEKNSMAKLRTTLPHPQGTGVVWVDTKKQPEVAGNAKAAPVPGAYASY